jgi:hypothetical protein
MRRGQVDQLDMAAVRSAIKGVVEADRFDHWLVEVPEPVLIQVAAPLEMLQFQYYLTPPRDRHLLRAARVCCAAVVGGLDGCPDDMVTAFGRLSEVVMPDPR